MFTYKSVCRFKMLIQADNRIIEIRPQQIITSNSLIDCSYLKLVEPTKRKRREVNGTKAKDKFLR